jgi:hypothetical protein
MMQNCGVFAASEFLETCEQFVAPACVLFCYFKGRKSATGQFPAGILLRDWLLPMSKSFAAELEVIANSLKSGDTANKELSISAIAERIAQNLHVKSDEVAVLVVCEKRRHLYFLVPEALRNVGQIPLSSTSALAARTVKESRPEIVNNFSTVRHASVFEGVKAETLTASAIQRIISAPILFDGKVIGAIQISRKAESLAKAGPEFTSDDLGKLLAICKPLGKLIQHVATD